MAGRAQQIRRLCCAALWLALMVPCVAVADLTAYSGSVEPCLSPHGDRDQYHAGLQSVGWTDIPDTDRAAALLVLADTFLSATGQIDASWADHVAYRAQARGFWDDLAQNRILMTRDGQILLLAGFATDLGEMVVECWVAGPQTNATDNFLALAGVAYQGDGVLMTQLNLPDDPTRPKTEIFVSRITSPTPIDPPLAGMDGLRTRITFMRPEVTL